MARNYDPSTHPQPASQAGEAGNSDSNDGWIQDDSQDDDADSSSSQSSVRADWIYGNGAAATADDANDVPAAAGVKRKADDANEVPVFGGNGGTGGNDTGRSFVVQPDNTALRTDTDADGTKLTSTWIRNAHGQWERHVKNKI